VNLKGIIWDKKDNDKKLIKSLIQVDNILKFMYNIIIIL